MAAVGKNGAVRTTALSGVAAMEFSEGEDASGGESAGEDEGAEEGKEDERREPRHGLGAPQDVPAGERGETYHDDQGVALGEAGLEEADWER